MDYGLTFPHQEIGDDPEAIARYAKRAEERGYGHLIGWDHVLGANADREGGWDGPYDHRDQFHEPLSLFNYLAGVTDKIEFVTGILILPQRQTALVAKLTAQVDLFSGGRLRLGIGVGWNPLEYVALGKDYHQRGDRLEEQVELLRMLWTENPTSFEGEFHEIPDMGINPLPDQQPIPLWMGGDADVVLRRIARTADGWIPRSHSNQTPSKNSRKSTSTPMMKGVTRKRLEFMVVSLDTDTTTNSSNVSNHGSVSVLTICL